MREISRFTTSAGQTYEVGSNWPGDPKNARNNSALVVASILEVDETWSEWKDDDGDPVKTRSVPHFQIQQMTRELYGFWMAASAAHLERGAEVDFDKLSDLVKDYDVMLTRHVSRERGPIVDWDLRIPTANVMDAMIENLRDQRAEMVEDQQPAGPNGAADSPS